MLCIHKQTGRFFLSSCANFTRRTIDLSICYSRSTCADAMNLHADLLNQEGALKRKVCCGQLVCRLKHCPFRFD